MKGAENNQIQEGCGGAEKKMLRRTNMIKKYSKFIVCIALSLALGLGLFSSNLMQTQAEEPFMFGFEVLLAEQKDVLVGKRVGLVTNPTGVDKELNSIVDVLYSDPDIDLVALYGPEHGVRGNAQAGAYVESYIDPVTQLPVYSLYGVTRKPTPEMLADVDVLLFDIQDAGVTYYTYIWTMYYLMEAAAENGKEVVILDRPNPLGGDYVGGPVVVEDGMSSFVGLKDLAVVHGMTFGELAKYFQSEYNLDVDLTVVPMKNYDRSKRYSELGVPFVMPSPNMPTTDTVNVYPMTGYFESFTNVSEGRGTTKPFQLIGAEFIDSTSYAKALNDLHLPGVRFRAAAFTPATGQKLAGKLAQGVEVYVTDTNTYDPIRTGLFMIKTMCDMYPSDVVWRTDNWLGKLTGKTYIEADLKAGVDVDTIIAKWQGELEAFKAVRAQYLIYGGTTPVTVDKTALQEAVDNYASVDETAYTVESYATFAAAMQQANQILLDTTATQEEVDNCLSELTSAYEALQEKAVTPLDTSALQEAIDAGKDLVEAEHTKDSWAPYAVALQEGKDAIVSLQNARAIVVQDDIDAKTKAIVETRAALVKVSSSTASGSTTSAGTKPATGDTSLSVFGLSALLLSGAAYMMLFYKKRRELPKS